MTLKQDKISSAIKKIAGEFLNLESDRKSMITPIHADVSKDLKNATIYVTVFPDSNEKVALQFLKTKRTDFRDFFKNHIKLRTLPFFDFKIDTGEKNRQKVEALSVK